MSMRNNNTNNNSSVRVRVLFSFLIFFVFLCATCFQLKFKVKGKVWAHVIDVSFAQRKKERKYLLSPPSI